MGTTGYKVLVAMSGGVDSSVAASLLQDAGHEVVGIFMRRGSAVIEVSQKLTWIGSTAHGAEADALGVQHCLAPPKIDESGNFNVERKQLRDCLSKLKFPI